VVRSDAIDAMATLVQRAIPVAVFLTGLGLAHAVGFRMQIPWGYFQLLDAGALARHPLASLCYLHTQPPGLNLLLSGVLAVALLVDAPPAAVASLLFIVVGLVAAIVLWRTLLTLTGSAVVATLLLIFALADPGYYVFEHLFFYEFLLHAALVLLLAATAGYLARGGRWRLHAIVALLAAISLTRTLYHPLWACALLIVVVYLRARLDEHRSRSLRQGAWAVVLLLALLCAWPLKNWLVFGRPFYSSTTPYNLARDVPTCPRSVIQPPLVGPEVSPDVATIAERAQRVCGPHASEVLTSPAKLDGSPNWNHAMYLVVAAERTRCGIAWRRDHPVDWLARAAGLYAMWTRPTFVHPYSSDMIIGPLDARYRRYAGDYDRVFFFDLRPMIERPYPGWFLHVQAMVRGQRVPYTVAGFVVFPAVAAAVLAMLASRRWHHCEALVAVALVCWLWPMAGAVLTDGWEGNRMRFSTAPAFLVMVGYTLGTLVDRWRSPRRQALCRCSRQRRRPEPAPRPGIGPRAAAMLALTPSTLVTTLPSLMFAVSRTFRTRFASRARSSIKRLR
jgi:hypothetical protein